MVIDQSNDRIRHKLTGTVEGDIAAAIGLDQLDAELCQISLRRDQMLSPLKLPPPAKRDDGWMLNQKQSFFPAGADLLMNLFLNGPRVAVSHCAKVLNEHGQPNADKDGLLLIQDRHESAFH
jgi:hypothetical protein